MSVCPSIHLHTYTVYTFIYIYVCVCAYINIHINLLKPYKWQNVAIKNQPLTLNYRRTDENSLSISWFNFIVVFPLCHRQVHVYVYSCVRLYSMSQFICVSRLFICLCILCGCLNCFCAYKSVCVCVSASLGCRT